MSDMATDLVPRTFTVDEYHRMAEAGIFDSGERVELLEGLIVRMSPIGVPHWMTHTRVVEYLMGKLKGRAIVPGDISVPLGDRNEPEPDIAVLAKLPYRRLNRPPEPAEIYAMIELADSSPARETRPKRRLYARFEIADYLVVDLGADVLIHFSRPADGDYPEPRRLGRGDAFTLSALPDIVLEAEPFLDER
jgi:Putative restriction endonuclease